MFIIGQPTISVGPTFMVGRKYFIDVVPMFIIGRPTISVGPTFMVGQKYLL
jgi:hypothetical protein